MTILTFVEGLVGFFLTKNPTCVAKNWLWNIWKWW